MALDKRNEYKLEVLENGTIQVRRADIISEDGVDIATNFVRHVIHPGDDVSGEPARVQAVAGAVHTAEVVAAYQATVDTEE